MSRPTTSLCPTGELARAGPLCGPVARPSGAWWRWGGPCLPSGAQERGAWPSLSDRHAHSHEAATLTRTPRCCPCKCRAGGTPGINRKQTRSSPRRQVQSTHESPTGPSPFPTQHHTRQTTHCLLAESHPGPRHTLSFYSLSPGGVRGASGARDGAATAPTLPPSSCDFERVTTPLDLHREQGIE